MTTRPATPRPPKPRPARRAGLSHARTILTRNDATIRKISDAQHLVSVKYAPQLRAPLTFAKDDQQ